MKIVGGGKPQWPSNDGWIMMMDQHIFEALAHNNHCTHWVELLNSLIILLKLKDTIA